MLFMLYIPPFFNTPLIWLCMKAVAKDLGCVLLPDSELNSLIAKRQSDNTLPGIAWNGFNYCAGRVVFTSDQYLCINVIGFLCFT